MAFIQKISVFIVVLTLSIQVSSQGAQFITGACANDAACESGCCGFNSGKCAGAIIALERDGGCGFGDATPNNNAAQLLRGELPAPVNLTAPIANPQPPPVNTTTPDQAPSDPPANNTQPITTPAPPPLNDTQPIDILPVNNTQPINVLPVNNTTPSSSPIPDGTQFITGVCTSDANCASKCCGFNSGKCAGPLVAQERDGGCGFGSAVPNDDAAKGLLGRWVRWARGRRSVV